MIRHMDTSAGIVPGSEVGGYKIVAPVGEGGMGMVYRAHDAVLDRRVALKVLHPHLSRNEEFSTRFIREGQTAARLEHPGIVQVYAAGKDPCGNCYIAMQFVEGMELHALMRRESRLPVHVALLVARDVAEALLPAHEADIIHRDIKPANIMLTPDGRVKVMDFGLARGVRSSNRLTETGIYLGTPEYSAPEQCTSDEIDQRADLYSLGVVLYEMLAGVVPHTAETPYSLFKKIVEEPAIPILDINPNVPRPIVSIVERLMAKDASDRYASAREVLAAIDERLAEFRGGDALARADLVGLLREAACRAADADEKTLRLAEGDFAVEPANFGGAANPRRPTPTYASRRTRLFPYYVAGSVLVLVLAIPSVLGIAWLASHSENDASSTGSDLAHVTAPSQQDPSGAPDATKVPLVDASGRTTIAVFEFRNLQKREDLDWMTVALPEVLTTALAGSPDLIVLTRDLVMEEVRKRVAGGGSAAPAQVAFALGAALAVRGNILPLPSDGPQARVQITIEVIREGHHLPAQKVEGSSEEVFRLVDQLARSVLDTIQAYRAVELGSRAYMPHTLAAGGELEIHGEQSEAGRLAMVDSEKIYQDRRANRNRMPRGGAGGRRVPGFQEKQYGQAEENGWIAPRPPGVAGDSRGTPSDSKALPDSPPRAESPPAEGTDVKDGDPPGDPEAQDSGGAASGKAGQDPEGIAPARKDRDEVARALEEASKRREALGENAEGRRWEFLRELGEWYRGLVEQRDRLEPGLKVESPPATLEPPAEREVQIVISPDDDRLGPCVQYFQANSWSLQREDVAALRAWAHAKATLENADASAEQIELALRMLELADALGQPQEDVDPLKERCQERLAK